MTAVDEDRHLTRYNPVPANQGDQTITRSKCIPVFGNGTVPAIMRLAPLTAPASDWPVVIFQHGITEVVPQNQLPAIATQLSAVAGFITIAIDHPLHGGRGI